MKQAMRHAKTATSPTFHGTGKGKISTSDEDLIVQGLSIAADSIEHHARTSPSPLLMERLTRYARKMRDLRDRLDA